MNIRKEVMYLRSVAVFMLALVLTLPFYSANAFAAVKITRNEGDAGVEGYLAADGDEWHVEATVSGDPVTRDRVKVNGYQFDRCVQDSLSGNTCEYEFGFDQAPEEEYPVVVEVFDAAGTKLEDAKSKIILDGGKPVLSNFEVVQEAGQVKVSFSAVDKPSKCVGLQRADFIDKSTGKAVKNISLSGCAADVDEIITISSESGVRRVGVEVFDRLGHKAAMSQEIELDLVAPALIQDTFKVGSAVDYVASGSVVETLSIEAEDDLGVLSAFITSTALGLDNVGGVCAISGETDDKNKFTCVWEDVPVNLQGSFSVTITVSDGGGNKDTRTVSKTFQVDDAVPQLLSFGSEHNFQGQNFAHTGRNKFVAYFDEAGSGMDAERVKADFSGVHVKYKGKKVAAGSCSLEDNWACVWEDIDVGHPGLVVLTEAFDNVGNDAKIADVNAAVEIDDVPPEINVERIFAAAIAGQSGEVRDIFQSRDKARVTFEVKEKNGIVVKADVSEIVDDGGIIDVVCSLKPEQDEEYECSFITERIRSGHILAADIVILVSDTAGNEVEVRYPIEIFAVGDEDDPAFWRNGGVSCSPDGVDVTVLKIGAQRVFCSAKFSTNAQNVEIVYTSLVGCEEVEDTVQQSAAVESFSDDPGTNAGAAAASLEPDVYMINNFRGNKAPQIVFEFDPAADVGLGEKKFQCELNIVTKTGNIILQTAERENVTVTIPFYETKFNNELSTIEDRIKDARKDAKGAWEIVAVLNDIFEWIKILCNILNLVVTVLDIIGLASASASDPLRATPFTIGAAIGMCHGQATTRQTTATSFRELYIICALATCAGATTVGLDTYSFNIRGFSWLINYQKAVLEIYNSMWILGPGIGTAAALIKRDLKGGDIGLSSLGQGRLAASPYDSIVLSAVSLCLPGIIYNLEKYRQIQCRYIGCLENEVKAGVATVGACRELRDYQECKYLWGELFQLIPFAGFVDRLLQALKQFLTDPVGALVLVVAILLAVSCQSLCEGSSTSEWSCELGAYFIYLLGFVNDLISAYNSITTTLDGADYCSQVGL